MKLQSSGARLVLELSGELDISTCPPITEALTVALADATVRWVVFDLRDVTFMDSSGIKCLVRALRCVRDRDGSVTVCNAQPNVARLIRLLGIDRQVDLVEALPSAPADDHVTRGVDVSYAAPHGRQRQLVDS